MQKEFILLDTSPPPGVIAWPKDDSINSLQAVITGPEDTPYEGGSFELEVLVPNSYPNEPPKVHFITPVYHPNVDSGGRICLDSLKMPPKGAWTPSLNISTLLTTIRLLLATPNTDDPLMPEITEQCITQQEEFKKTARNWTHKYANAKKIVPNPSNKEAETTTKTPTNSLKLNPTTAVNNTDITTKLNLTTSPTTTASAPSSGSGSEEEEIPKIRKLKNKKRTNKSSPPSEQAGKKQKK